MFGDAYLFDGNISNWDTSNVTDMTNMFRYTYKFNQKINTKSVTVGTKFYKAWNTYKVESMAYMFYDAKAFREEFNDWDIQGLVKVNSAISFNVGSNPKNIPKFETKHIISSYSDREYLFINIILIIINFYRQKAKNYSLTFIIFFNFYIFFSNYLEGATQRLISLKILIKASLYNLLRKVGIYGPNALVAIFSDNIIFTTSIILNEITNKKILIFLPLILNVSIFILGFVFRFGYV